MGFQVIVWSVAQGIINICVGSWPLSQRREFQKLSNMKILLMDGLLYRQQYIVVSLSSGKCTSRKSLWLHLGHLLNAPKCKC